MNKQELIKAYEGAPFSIVSINGVLEDLKRLDEPQPIKLKDVIARIEKFDLGTKAVWINEILYKLGSDYGLHKYYAGYKQGKFDGDIEREKPVVPQFVADWIFKAQLVNRFNLREAFKNVTIDLYFKDSKKVKEWLSNDRNQKTFARAWLDGYEVEKEKRYSVKMKGLDSYSYIKYSKSAKKWFFSSKAFNECAMYHTRKELEEAGFGEVFNSPLFEVEEVE